MKKLNRANILKGAGVLLIAVVMISSTISVMANTNEVKIPETSAGLCPESVSQNYLKKSLTNPLGKGQNCFAFEVYLFDMSIHFNTDTPETITTIAPMTSVDFMAGGTWADGAWYGCEYSDAGNSNIWAIDETTGAMALIGPSSAGLNGMAYDDNTDTFYGASSTDLYTIDIATGAATLVGAMGNGGGVMIGIACDNDGNLYGEDLGDDSLYSINPTTGVATLIGSFGGIDLNYAQDCEYDKNNDILYLSTLTIHAGNEAGLYSVDVSTGAATLVGMFHTELVEVTCFAIPYGGPQEIPDLDCDGTLGWEDVDPGATVTGSFTVENVGDPGSLLDWEIQSYPDWGTWTFTPESGADLTPEDGAITVDVEVVAPDEPETEFEGEVKIVNSDDPADFCIVEVALATPVNQEPTGLFGWVFLRGLVFNPRDDGSTISARALNLHYIEITPMGIHKGVVRLKKVSFRNGIFIKMSEKGLLGNMVRISGFCHGGIEIQ